jgi:phenylalanyl-tRNA synthetase beta chain
MKISANVLKRFCAGTPAEPKVLRRLLDDLGIEVKRLDVQDGDARLTLELLANRGDHHCYAGVAREVAARTKTALTLPEARTLPVGAPPLPLVIESDKCLLYTATPFRVTGGLKKSLGKAADELLEAAGLLTGNAAIDVTNLVNLELGQPSHAFDRARIQGGITIRLSRAGEKAWLLFTPEARELPVGTLVIADDVKVLAIAGVIGCEDSKIQDDTTEIILESAAFDPVAVRIGGRALAVHTDASARFERGSDPTLAAVATGRIAHLLAEAGVAEVTGPLGLVGAWKDPARVLPLRASELSAFLGRDFADSEIVERLRAYGFEQRALGFKVPAHRLWDVESEEDLFEEVARSVGFNDLPEGLPPVALGARPSQAEVLLRVAEDVLVGAGFYEMYTDGFYSRQIPERLGQAEGLPLFAHVETVNSLDNSFSLLKNNCLAQAVQAVADNLNVKAQDVRLYEWTRTFHPDPKSENGVCTERDVLYGVCSGKERPEAWEAGGRAADVFFLKGVVEQLQKSLDLPLELTDPDASYALTSLMHPHRCLSLRIDGQSVGVVGEVSPQVLQAFGIKFAKACYFEISRDALLTAPRGSAAFEMPPVMPDIERMLSFAVPAGVSTRAIVPLLKAGAPAWLERISVADVFAGSGDTAKRAVAFKLVFNATEPRTSDQLNDACAAMVKSVVDALGSRGVEQR